MEESPLISILIPVYNGKQFLEKTMCSIQEQTFKDYEVICIDDHSTDGSYEYLLSLSKFDDRIQVIRRKDKGGNASKGISYGLSLCKGKYFFYMSQDDFISNDCLEKCFNKIEETQSDICIPDLVFFNGNYIDNKILKAPDNNYEQLLSGEEAFFKCIIYELSGFSLRRMELVKRVGQDDKYFDSCDKSMAFQYYFSNKVSFCNAKFFYRQNNPDAITKLFSIQNLYHLDTCNEVLEFSIKHNIRYSYIRKFIEVFMMRRICYLKKILFLKEEDQRKAISILNYSLCNMRNILLKKGYFKLYVNTFSLYYLKNKFRIILYSYFLRNNFTKNFLFKKVSNSLLKKGFLPESSKLFIKNNKEKI